MNDYVSENHAKFGRPLLPDGRRSFTVGQANRSLLLVKRIVADVMDLHVDWLECQETCELLRTRGGAHVRLAERRLADVTQRLHACIEDLREVGVELRDWSLGIVDFPGHAVGREIRLCWRWGEQRVEFWHEVGEGYVHRQPLHTLIAEGAMLGAT